MIQDIMNGDITAPNNPRDIIIGMNSQLSDVTGIGLKFLRGLVPMEVLKLGAVISFDFDDDRKLHMIICHDLGKGGWRNADQHVRFGLDYLHHLNESSREHSIVQIGTGRVGKRDGADHAAIRAAIATSFLPVILYKYEEDGAEAMAAEIRPLKPFEAWTVDLGRVPIHAHA